MLDDYKERQSVTYRQLKNILNDNLSHAFIFIINKNIYADGIVISFAKSIICKNKFTNKKSCIDCNICERIDNNDFSELKIIRPDGLWIKKDQLIELQKEMSTKPIEGKKKVYIIYEAEKMNSSAANCLLKFLEEPFDDIVAILVTDNYNQLIDTIASRCQTIALNNSDVNEYIKKYDFENKTLLKLFLIYNNKEEINEYMNNKDNKKFLDNVIKFILKYEQEKIRMICYNKKYFIDLFKQKDEIYYVFELITLFYKDVLQYKIKKSVNYFDSYIYEVEKISNEKTKEEIIKKLNIIIRSKENIKSGMNINLFLEKLIVELEGGIKNA